MEDLETQLGELERLARRVASVVLGAGATRPLDERALVAVLAATGRVQRLVEAAQIEIVGEIDHRNTSPVVEGRLVDRLGCHNVSELVQRATRLSPTTAGRLAKAAAAIRQPVSVTTGEVLPPMLPALREAVRDGAVGLDGAMAIAGPLMATGSRVSRDALLAADGILAAEARGEGPDAAPPACADLLRVQAQVWAMALNPDGAEPRERRAMHARAFTLGTATEQGVPVHGMLLHEVAAQFQRIADAVMNPRVDADRVPGVRFADDSSDPAQAPVDTRTRAQKQHDALATALGVAASSELLPTLGGAAPTLVVTVREEDLAAGHGYAHLDGCSEPVALTVATHAGCAGVVQRVGIDARGRIRTLGT